MGNFEQASMTSISFWYVWESFCCTKTKYDNYCYYAV